MPPEQIYSDTNEQAKRCCIKRSDTTFRVTNKLSAMDSVVSGWRGAEFFQPKLQQTVQEVGSWAASELHTSTAVHPSPKPETTKAFAPQVRKSWSSSAFGGQQLQLTVSSPGFISRHSPFLLLRYVHMHFGLFTNFSWWCDWKLHLVYTATRATEDQKGGQKTRLMGDLWSLSSCTATASVRSG